MAKYKHFIYNDIEVADSDYKNISPHIKKTVVTQDSSELVNSDYDETVSQEWYLNNRVAPKVNTLLADSDEMINREYSLTAGKKTTLQAYRKSLWELEATIKQNGFSDLSFPSEPVWFKDKKTELKSRGVVR